MNEKPNQSIEEQYRQEKPKIEPLRPAFRAQLRQQLSETSAQTTDCVGMWASAVAVLAVVVMVGSYFLSVRRPISEGVIIPEQQEVMMTADSADMSDKPPTTTLAIQDVIEAARDIAENPRGDILFVSESADFVSATKLPTDEAIAIIEYENTSYARYIRPAADEMWIVSFSGEWWSEERTKHSPHFVVMVTDQGEFYRHTPQSQISEAEAIEIAKGSGVAGMGEITVEPEVISAEQTTYRDAWRRTHLHSPITPLPERDDEPVWLIYLTGNWTINGETFTHASLFFNAEIGGSIQTQFHITEEAAKLADGILPDAEHVAALVNHFAERRLSQIGDGWLHVASDVYDPDAAADESQRRLYPDPTMRHEGWYDFNTQIGLFHILAADGNATQIVVFDGDQAYNLTFNDQHESQPVSLDMQLPAANARLYLKGAEELHAQYNEDRSEVTVSLRWMETDRQFRYSAENGRLLEYKDSQQTITYLTAENVAAPPADVREQIAATLAEMRDADFNPNGIDSVPVDAETTDPNTFTLVERGTVSGEVIWQTTGEPAADGGMVSLISSYGTLTTRVENGRYSFPTLAKVYGDGRVEWLEFQLRIGGGGEAIVPEQEAMTVDLVATDAAGTGQISVDQTCTYTFGTVSGNAPIEDGYLLAAFTEAFLNDEDALQKVRIVNGQYTFPSLGTRCGGGDVSWRKWVVAVEGQTFTIQPTETSTKFDLTSDE